MSHAFRLRAAFLKHTQITNKQHEEQKKCPQKELFTTLAFREKSSQS